MITRFTFALLLTISTATSAGWFSPGDTVNVDKFQPKIVATEAPFIVRGWLPYHSAEKYGLTRWRPLIVSYTKEGKLIASWNPQKEPAKAPTVILLHGGHGVGNGDLAMGRWAFDKLGANVLILDSFWSRGIEENWKTDTKFGANMRVLDLIAAGRFVRSEVGAESKLFAIGGSQGGWTVLRALTASNPVNKEVRELFTAGVALYPVCQSDQRGVDDMYPILGNEYSSPVVVLTGGQDEATNSAKCNRSAIFRAAQKWVHFENATHGWDAPPSADMKSTLCTRAQNIYNRFPICFDQEVTDQTRIEIEELVNRFLRTQAAHIN